MQIRTMLQVRISTQYTIYRLRAHIIQGCTNLGRQVAWATKFCNICESSQANLLHVTLLAPKILVRILDFWKIFAPLT
jgi:hypothetical protein